MKSNKKWYYSTFNMIVAYTIFYMVLLLLNDLPRALAQFVPTIATYLSEGFVLPVGIFSWGLLAMVAAYAGVDRAQFITKTSLMEMGSADFGNLAKLRQMIVLLFIVFLESVLLNVFFSSSFNLNGKEFPGVSIDLDAISSALVSVITIYVLGNKGIRLAQNLDTTKETQSWANEVQETVTVSDGSTQTTQVEKESTVSNEDSSSEVPLA